MDSTKRNNESTEFYEAINMKTQFHNILGSLSLSSLLLFMWKKMEKKLNKKSSYCHKNHTNFLKNNLLVII